MPNVILVTGGTGKLPSSSLSLLELFEMLKLGLVLFPPSGLVGSAIQHTIDHEAVGSRYGKFQQDDQWVFLSSKDGDLR